MEKRREFLKTGAKLFCAAGFLVSFSATKLLAQKGFKMQYLTLHNGIKMPILGYGTYSIRDSKTILDAINVGYRLIDTAQMYGNEKEVGEALRQSGVKREDFFIETKLSHSMSYDETKKAIEKSLKNLGLDYIDLLLIHEPYGQSKEMYRAMEEFYEEGLLKSIGISNFSSPVYLDFVKTCKIIPMINQCETHPFYQQKTLIQSMKPYKTLLQSYSPFVSGRDGIFSNKTLQEIAVKHSRSVAQVSLRFLIQQGIIAIPKSSKIEHMRQNINIFDFKLDDEDMAKISKLDKNKSSFSWGY